jgi:RNA polymerase sigma-70 factor, ECF subfamily
MHCFAKANQDVFDQSLEEFHLPHSDTASLVERAQSGSQGAFSLLYQRFAPLVHSIFLRRSRAAVADELTQDCFEHAFGRLHQLKEKARFGAWIAIIARRMGSAEASSAHHQPLDDLQAAASLGASTSSPEASTQAQQVLRCICELPEAYSEPLLMRLVQGLSGPEIAELTGLTPDSVRVNLHRGMAKLRERLQAPMAKSGPNNAHHVHVRKSSTNDA